MMLRKTSRLLRRAVVPAMPVIGAVIAGACSAPPAFGQNTFISATGTFNSATGQFIDFNFAATGFEVMAFKTYASSGGINSAGQSIGSLGIDSQLTLFNSGNASIAFNDDANDNHNFHDSLLAPSGTGTSHLVAVAAGTYRLRMDNFGSNVGNGAFAVDLLDATENFNVNGIAVSPSAVLKTLTVNGSPGFFPMEVNVDSSHPLSFASGGVLNLLGSVDLDLSGGALNTGATGLEQLGATQGEATVTQSGGSNSALSLFLGTSASTNAGYFMSGGTAQFNNLLVASNPSGIGEIAISSGTINVSTSLQAGGGVGSTSTITLSGGGLNASSISLASNGSSTFLQSGGAASIVTLAIGANGGNGTYSMQGGTLLSSSITVGGVGLGTMLLGVGAVAQVPGQLTISPQGFVSVTGGTLNAGTVTVGTGGALGTFSFSSGTLSLNSSLRIGNGGLIGSNLILSNKNVLVSGTGTIDPGASVQINGGIFSVGTLVNSGSFLFNTGTFALTASNLTVGTAGLFGPNLEIKSGQSVNVVSVANNVTVGSNGLLTISGGSLSASGSVNLLAGSQLQLNGLPSQISAGSISNSGLITGSGRLLGTFGNASSGEVRANSGDSLQFEASTASNAGRVNLFGGVADFSGTMTNTGTIAGNGTLFAGTLNNSGTINALSTISAGSFGNSGTVQLSSGHTDILGPSSNSGRITIAGGNTTTFYSDFNTSTGTITIGANSTAVFFGFVTGQNHVAGSGLKDYEGGFSGGPIASLVGDTYVGTLANVNTQFFNEDDLSISGNATIALNGSSTGASRVHTLEFIDSGKLDLNDNDLIVDYSGASPLSTIVGYIVSGRHGGDWLGNSLTSTPAHQASVTSHPTALGYGEASALGISAFDGQAVDNTTVLVRYTWSGDANLDGLVNALDFNALASNFGGGSGKFWFQGDFNYDGITNTLDFNALASNFNQPAFASPALGTLIPEPTAIALATFAVFVFAPRRRH